LAEKYGLAAEELEQFLLSTGAFVKEPAHGMKIEGLLSAESYPQSGIVLFNATGPGDAYAKRLRDFTESGHIWAASFYVTPEIFTDLLDQARASEKQRGAVEFKISSQQSVWFDPEFVYELRAQLRAGIRATLLKKFPLNADQVKLAAAIGSKFGLFEIPSEMSDEAFSRGHLPDFNLTKSGFGAALI
jgi:hypothetical protein